MPRNTEEFFAQRFKGGSVRLLGGLQNLTLEGSTRRYRPRLVRDQIRLALMDELLGIKVEVMPGRFFRPRFHMELFIDLSVAEVQDYKQHLLALRGHPVTSPPQ